VKAKELDVLHLEDTGRAEPAHVTSGSERLPTGGRGRRGAAWWPRTGCAGAVASQAATARRSPTHRAGGAPPAVPAP
jgi:hypothetical protein